MLEGKDAGGILDSRLTIYAKYASISKASLFERAYFLLDFCIEIWFIMLSSDMTPPPTSANAKWHQS
jgi:hypothetical protein